MRISQLLEDVNPELRELIVTLRRECSEFISRPTILYRGADLYSDAKLFVDVPIRTDRRSLSRKNLATAMFNQMFEETFNVKDIRNRCLFAINDRLKAIGYGELWYVFPKNGAKIACNPEILDSIVFMRNIAHFMVGAVSDHGTDEDKEFFMDWFRTHDADPVVQEGWFDELLNNVSPKLNEVLLDEHERVKERLVNGYHVYNINELPTFSTDVEFMIFDIDSYIAIDPSILRGLPGFPGNDQAAWTQLISYLR